jgi:hypothetical protein
MNSISKKIYNYSGAIAAGTTLAMAGAGRALAANSGSVGGGDYSLTIKGSPNFSSGGSADSFKNSIPGIAGQVINILLLLSGILAVIYLIWSGFQYITSAGNADKAKAARAGIINAVIGIVVIVAAFFIVRFAVGIGNTVSGTDGAGTSSGL